MPSFSSRQAAAGDQGSGDTTLGGVLGDYVGGLE